jgi:hypothetical protein
MALQSVGGAKGSMPERSILFIIGRWIAVDG